MLSDIDINDWGLGALCAFIVSVIAGTIIATTTVVSNDDRRETEAKAEVCMALEADAERLLCLEKL